MEMHLCDEGSFHSTRRNTREARSSLQETIATVVLLQHMTRRGVRASARDQRTDSPIARRRTDRFVRHV